MYNCKDFYSFSVLSLYEGELIGKVDKLYFDKKMKKLTDLELIGENDARFILPTKNIYNVGKNAITVKNNQSIEIKSIDNNVCVVPIGAKSFSISGEFLGVVEEVVINQKFICEKILLDNGKSKDIKDIATCGKNTVIFYNNHNKININNFMPTKQPKNFKQGAELPVVTQPVKEEQPGAVPLEEESVKKFLNSDFLVGRICTKDIFNFNNELLIKANTAITKKNLKEINKFKKLREVMLYSVTKT